MTHDQELTAIRTVLAGDTEAYRPLVERHHQGLILYLLQLTHNQAEAEDIAQETFLQAYRNLARYSDNFAFSTWLYRIGRNLALKQLEKQHVIYDLADIEETIPDERDSASLGIDKEFDATRVREAVRTLPDNYREVITLYYWQDVDYEEIARIMNRPVNTIRTWLRRAKDQLRKELYGYVR